MSFEPDPEFLIYLVIAIFAVLTIGAAVAAARNAAAIPLAKECIPLVSGSLSGSDLLRSYFLCGMGIIIFVGVPGAIGIGAMVLRSR